MRTTALALTVLGACNSMAGPTPTAAPAPGAGHAADAPLRVTREVVFEGMCDASGAVELDPTTFVVADDEDNLLRVYDAERGGPPLAAIDVSQDVGLAPKGKKLRFPELDLEAATRIGDRAYWITSHGRNSAGKLKPERMRFFATTLPRSRDDARAVHVTAVSDRFLDDLLADPRFAALGLGAAAELAPKAEGGLNLEGMTASPDGTLLLGLRNPVPDGLAILFTLGEPEQALRGPATLGAPIRLDLGGQGVRALTWWRGRYLIVAGHFDSGGTSSLYGWDGATAPTRLAIDLTGYNPEATFTPDAGDEFLLLSDDGTVELDGVPCKDVEDRARRRFRGTWVGAAPAEAPAPAPAGG